MKDNLYTHLGLNEEFFKVTSDNLDQCITYIEENQITNITVNPHLGYNLSNVDFLLKLKNVKKLELGGCGNIDISSVQYLTTLEHLSTTTDQSLDLSKLSRLRFLNFVFNKKIIGLEMLKELQTIGVSKANEVFLNKEIFSNYRHLVSLSIGESKLLEDMSFIPKGSLKYLNFTYCRGEINLKNIDTYCGDLESLILSNSKNIINFESVYGLKELKTLKLIDSISLKDTSIILNFPKLEMIVVTGKSQFMEGDLTMLKKIKYVGITDRKHYNLKMKDFVN